MRTTFRHVRQFSKGFQRRCVRQALTSGQIRPIGGGRDSYIDPRVITIAEVHLEDFPVTYRGFAFCSKRDYLKGGWSKRKGREIALERARRTMGASGLPKDSVPPGGTGSGEPAGG
jgi:hypothetical protein